MPQNKLTAVKIKQENGTYSPQIPIAAKVENIEYDKQYSVKDVLGTVNINKGPLQDQIDALPAQMTAEAVNNWMDNHVTAQTQVVIDNSLSTQGAAADAEATGQLRKMIIINSETSPSNETKLRFNTTNDVVSILTTDDIDPSSFNNQVNNLKAKMNELFLNSENLTSNFIDGYINTNKTEGTQIASTPTSNSSYKCIIVPCKKGDIFTIYGRGGTNPRLWAFTDNEYILLSHVTGTPSVTEENPFILTASEDGYFIANVAIATAYGLVHGFYRISTDSNLTQPGIPADAKAVGDAFEAVNTRIDNKADSDAIDTIESRLDSLNEFFSINEEDLTSNYQTAKYIDLSGSIGSSISLDPLGTPNYNCISFSCKKDDVFIIFGDGGSNPRLWGFIDTDKKLLSVASAGAKYSENTPLSLTAEQDGYFISNVLNGSTHSYGLTYIPHSFSIQVDKTLTKNNVPADAKIVGDTFETINENVSILTDSLSGIISNSTPVSTFSDPLLRQYINTNQAVGTTISWDTPSTSVSINVKWAVVPCSAGDLFTINGKGGNSSRLWAFLDEDKKLISKACASVSWDNDNLIIKAPVNSAWLIINDELNKTSYIGVPAKKLNEIESLIENKPLIGNKPLIQTVVLDSGGDYNTNTNQIGTAPVMREGSGFGIHKEPFNVSFANGGFITFESPSIVTNGGVGGLFCDENNRILSKFVTSDIMIFNEDDNIYRGSVKIPEGAYYLMFSAHKGSSNQLTLTFRKDVSNQPNNSIRYVTVNGSDTENGMRSTTAMATINKAIESGGKTILLGDGAYFQSISLENAADDIRFIPMDKNSIPVLYAPNSLLSETENAVSGYTKVYSFSCDRTFAEKNNWIYQEGVPDTTTEITNSDRHPLQKGRAYRCADTKIARCSATILSDALTEIEDSNEYKWFIDTDNSILYFSRPSSVTVETPIMASFGGGLFRNVPSGVHLEMTGINVKYQPINLDNMINPILTDCSCGNIFGAGAFRWNYVVGVKLYRCEGYRTYNVTTGDGFNAHGNGGGVWAKKVTSMMFDCWAHDNSDDGYSDHERCETTIYGGLYEYNGDGITPAVGSHCTCYNVLSRYNGHADFFYSGNPTETEGGVGGQIACYGCISKGDGKGVGYRLNGSEVQGLFVNCIAIERLTAFMSENTGGTQIGTLINCSTINCTNQKNVNSIFTSISGYPTFNSSAWDGAHLEMGNYHFWVDSDGNLRKKSSAPESDTDGSIVG